ERYPSWSPDGKFIAYWSDRSGEYELTVKNVEKPGEEKKLSSYGAGFRYQTYWSPDSRFLAFVDKAMVIYIYDLEQNQTIEVDEQKFLYQSDLQSFSVSWSPDSRYIAFEKNLPNMSNAIAVFDVEEKKLREVTSGFYSDRNPVFDPEGKYLYFLTNREFSPIYSDFEGTFIYANSTHIAALSLNDETLSPIAPENDTTSIKKEEGEKEKGNKEKEGKSDIIPSVQIDWEGLESRLVILPPSPGNYRRLGGVKGKILYLKYPVSGTEEMKGSLTYYDVKERKEKEILANVNGYVLSANGEKILVNSEEAFAVVDVAEGQKMEKRMPVDKMEMILVPQEEWRQLFLEAWRLERDFFYDPNMHGVDWNAMKDRYSKLLDHAVTRWDINFIIGELIGEISASHTYRGGGDTEQAPQEGMGYLGIDWGFKNGAYFVKRIVQGAPWDELRSALNQPGINVNVGDYIL